MSQTLAAIKELTNQKVKNKRREWKMYSNRCL